MSVEVVRSNPGPLHRRTRPLDYRLMLRFPRARLLFMRWVLRKPPTARVRRFVLPRAAQIIFSAYERGEIRAPIEATYASDLHWGARAIQGVGPIDLPSLLSHREELIEFQAEWTEVFAWVTWVVNEFLDFGDAIVFELDQEAEGRMSGAITSLRMFGALRFEGGLVTWQEFFEGRDEAIRAIGRDPARVPAG